MYTPNFCLLIFISFTADLLFAYPLREEEIGSSTTVGETQGPTADRKENAPSGHTWTTAEIYGVTLGLVPGLELVISLGAFCYYWYHTSYRRVLIDWKKRNISGHPRNDCRVVFGRDGRASWTDCYGPYDAQTAVDMINTVMLCQDRNPDPLLGQMPIFTIKGRELKSVENAFTELYIGDRPSFTYQRHQTPKPDRRQAAFDKRKKKIQDKKDKRNAKKAKREKQRAKLLEANRDKLEVTEIETAKQIAAQKKNAEKKLKDPHIGRADGKVTTTSTSQVNVSTMPELPEPGPSTHPAPSSQGDIVIDIEPQQKSGEGTELSAPECAPPAGESVSTQVESELRYY